MKILFFILSAVSVNVFAQSTPEFYTRATAHFCYGDFDEELSRTYQTLQSKADKVCGSRAAIKVTNNERHANDKTSCSVTLEAGFICSEKGHIGNDGLKCRMRYPYVIECCDSNGICQLG